MMKQTVEFDKIQQQMQKGVITLNGFLGDDKRKLVDILESDNLTVKNLRRTHEAIAERMKYFRKRGTEGLGEFITVDENFEVKVETVRGVLPSPFGGKGMYGKANTTVRNKKLDKAVVFTDLHIHFIGDHGFYEGKGSPFRLEPEELITVLEVPVVEE
ncbi:hypothetical protein [Sphaerochaeta sp.]|jgi:hypothetical protein|uniref:hypothetical protein n=1 Tax=Sphaerochaeta sp. TaxID=1972642 RepID=UPI003D0E7FB6